MGELVAAEINGKQSGVFSLLYISAAHEQLEGLSIHTDLFLWLFSKPWRGTMNQKWWQSAGGTPVPEAWALVCSGPYSENGQAPGATSPSYRNICVSHPGRYQVQNERMAVPCAMCHNLGRTVVFPWTSQRRDSELRLNSFWKGWDFLKWRILSSRFKYSLQWDFFSYFVTFCSDGQNSSSPFLIFIYLF